MIKLKDILFEELNFEEDKKDEYRLVVIYHYDPKDLSDTDVRARWEKEAKKITSEYYMVEMDGSYVIKEDNKITIHNAKDKKGFVINPDNTLVLVKSQVDSDKKLSWLDGIISLERSGVFCVNPSNCKRICNDKYLSMLYFADNNLRQPKTVLVGNQDTAIDDFKRLKSDFPIILKTSAGTQGIGVVLIESGAEASPHKLTKLEAVECIKAAKSVDGIWVGVDFIPSGDRVNKKPYMLEANSNPGTAGIEKVLDRNIALEVLESFKDRSKWLKPKPFKSIYD